MQQMLHQLSSDHRQVEKLLASLEDIHNQTGPLSLDMLHDMLTILHGLEHEQVQKHHELEDQALDLLKSRHRLSDIMIGVLERDHVRLDAAAANAITIVKQALKDPIEHPYAGIKHQVGEFTQAYRDHIRTEEDVIFPMIRQLIAEQTVEAENQYTALSA